MEGEENGRGGLWKLIFYHNTKLSSFWRIKKWHWM